MKSIERLEDIVIWQKSRSLVKILYSTTYLKNCDRDFEYRNQIRGAGISIMSNIAEGYGRRTNVEFSRFLDISHGSCEEVKSLLYIGLDLKYLNQEKFELLFSLTKEISVMIRKFSNYLRKQK
ncbi:four helix bundle protein [Candidatus Dependentiae bacterium]|nr:four helix bundle protein [Candidatus Dependentiae bacterium]